MRIGGLPPARPVSLHGGVAATRGPSAFAVAGETARAQGAAPVAGLAMPLLLPVDDLVERRRKGARRGRALLDALDGLKLALLSGNVTEAALETLARAGGSIDAGDDPVLADVLEAIQLRADVELAKAAMRRTG